MDLPIDIIDATNRFQETVIEVCETVNWKHDQVTYCSYNSKGEFILRLVDKVYTLILSPDPTPDDLWKHDPLVKKKHGT